MIRNEKIMGHQVSSTTCMLSNNGQIDLREGGVALREGPTRGLNLSINVDPFEIWDETPEDEENRSMVKGLKNCRTGGASKIQAEDMNMWLSGMRDEEEKGQYGTGDKCLVFVRHIQFIWEQGNIPR